MIIVNSSTFRTEQSRYLDLAAKGESIIVTRNNHPSVVVTCVDNFDLIPSKDITADIVEALREVKDMQNGKLRKISAKTLLDEI